MHALRSTTKNKPEKTLASRAEILATNLALRTYHNDIENRVKSAVSKLEKELMAKTESLITEKLKEKGVPQGVTIKEFKKLEDNHNLLKKKHLNMIKVLQAQQAYILGLSRVKNNITFPDYNGPQLDA